MKKSPWLPWLMIGGMLVLTLACDEATPTPERWSAPTPPPVTSIALQPTLEQAQVEAYIDAVRAERLQREAQVTLDAYHGQQTATAVAYNTLSARIAAQQAWDATATADARAATATAVAWQTTVEAGQAYATATAEANRATATANAMLFSQSATATAAAWAMNATATAESLRVSATVQAAGAERARLAAERERMVYPLQAFGPWVLGVVLLASLLLTLRYVLPAVVMKFFRAVPRDSRGDSPVFILPMNKGGMMIYDPDRSVGPALVVDHQVSQPTLAPLMIQERVTARDQAVDLAHRGLPIPAGSAPRRRPVSPARAAELLTSARETPPSASGLRVIAPDRIRPWLDEVTPLALSAVIEGEIEED